MVVLVEDPVDTDMAWQPLDSFAESSLEILRHTLKSGTLSFPHRSQPSVFCLSYVVISLYLQIKNTSCSSSLSSALEPLTAACRYTRREGEALSDRIFKSSCISDLSIQVSGI
ncbi:hypothetical protein L3X38_034291 [Prunus dulcis]|uniref:Uncharacterized protein n=1 Tax=Prunus dulcis TaxID=3755 RepID=A0AAD4VK16_PRUDU|nr:hypothetical protein L3X38_034291 [Prunus dulcis]